MDNGPKPCVHQMLEVADAMGLTTVREAFSNYTRHYDMFFLIANYAQQMDELICEMARLGLVSESDDLYVVDEEADTSRLAVVIDDNLIKDFL